MIKQQLTTDIGKLTTENCSSCGHRQSQVRDSKGFTWQGVTMWARGISIPVTVSQRNIYPCYPADCPDLGPGCTRLQLSCCHFPIMWPGVRNSCQIQQRSYLLKNFKNDQPGFFFAQNVRFWLVWHSPLRLLPPLQGRDIWSSWDSSRLHLSSLSVNTNGLITFWKCFPSLISALNCWKGAETFAKSAHGSHQKPTESQWSPTEVTWEWWRVTAMFTNTNPGCYANFMEKLATNSEHFKWQLTRLGLALPHPFSPYYLLSS